MKILYASSEAVPFIKSGGLADVAGTLPHSLHDLGEEVAVFLPKYSLIDESFRNRTEHVCDFYVELGWRAQYCGVDKLSHDGVDFYFIDNEYYFRRGYIYGSMCMDECERFSFFNKAVLEAALHMGFCPDVVHVNDWQCGFIPYLMRVKYQHQFSNAKSVYTIHNIHYQGIFNMDWVCDFLSVDDRDKASMEFYGDVSFMKCGIVWADKVTTVSPTYANEICSSELGEGLSGVLAHKGVSGILNGIDNSQYSPYDDIYLDHHYASYELSGKSLCKESLQYEMWLDREPHTPLLCIVSRLTEQKGFSLVEHTWEKLMESGAELAVIGTGDAHFESFFRWLSSRCGGRVAARIEYSERLSHRAYAGSDIFLMPSRTEPCGLAQLIAMRYGTLPVVHETGGLRDTVIPFNKYTGEGTGFTFYEYNDFQFINAVERAIEAYHDKKMWEILVNRVMQSSFTWETSARRYIDLYRS